MPPPNHSFKRTRLRPVLWPLERYALHIPSRFLEWPMDLQSLLLRRDEATT